MNRDIIYRSGYRRSGRDLQLEAFMLNEGMGTDVLKDVLQFAVGAALEYGGGAAAGIATIPAAGAGVAAGPALETVADSLFAAESVKSTVEGVAGLMNSAGSFTKLIQDAYGAYNPRNWKGYYNTLKRLVQVSLATFSGARKSVDKAVEKLKEVLEDLINGITRPIQKAIQLIIPDATIGVAAAKGLGTALRSLAENAYTVITKIIDKIPALKNFVSDPSVANSFFDEMIDKLVAAAEIAADKIGEFSAASVVKTIATTAVTGGAGMVPALITKGLGPSALRFAAEKVKKYKQPFLSLVANILKVVIPLAITGVALFQIVMKGDYNMPGSDRTSNTNSTTAPAPTQTPPVAEARLRRKIRTLVAEELGPQHRPRSHASAAPIVTERWQRLAGIIKG